MSDLRFGIEINAKDKTQGGLKAALSSVTGFARGAMGAMRDFNLGLRPAIAGLGQLISRGGELEVITKSFRSMTGGMVGGADALAKKLVNASSGVLKLSEAMAIANRALGSGMKLNDVATAIEFIGKKSVATGKDAKAALDTVITGLSRGSTLFLDDFGILVDGVNGVKRSFDSIKGKGAFDALGPAAKKAETIRQAVAEMSGQMGRMGVTGREATFVFQSMGAQVGDAVDKLSLAFIKSKSVLGALTQTRDLMRGLGLHFEKGGSLGDVLFGKKGGKSGGLAGVAGAALGDIGRNLGHGIAGALFGALAEGSGALEQLFTVAKTQGNTVIGEWETTGKATIGRLGGSLVAELRKSADAFWAMMPGWVKPGTGGGGATTQPSGPAGASTIGILRSGLGAVPGAIPGVVARDAAREVGVRGVQGVANVVAKQTAKELAEQQALHKISALTGDAFGASTLGKGPGQAMASRLGVGGLKVLGKIVGPLAIVADFGLSLSKFVDEALGLQKDLGDLHAAEARAKEARIRLKGMKPQARGPALSGNPGLAAIQAFGIGAMGVADGGLRGMFGGLAKGQFDQLGFGNLRGQVNGFMGDFAQNDPQREAAAALVGDLAGRLPMSKAARANAERQLAISRRRSGIMSRGGFGIGIAARKEAIEGLKSLRAAGRDLSDPATRKRVFGELEAGARRRMIREAKNGTDDQPGPDAQVRGINQALRKDNLQRFQNRNDAANKVANEDVNELVAAVKGQTDAIGRFIATLMGENARIAAAK